MLFVVGLLRKYPLASLCVAAIWYLSFFTPPRTELDNVAFIDKWVHIVMYGGTCAVAWGEYILRNGHRHITPRAIAFGWLAPILMSGAIELLQAYCTGGRRSGDWLDLAANATGVTLALAAGWLAARLRSRRRKDGE